MSRQETAPLGSYVEKSYLNYAMYVILDRALPFVGDGLKPVQRRILYAMKELSLHPQGHFKKSARTVGDVLGKYHPHGDSACYEAMVNMAQPFSYRYPLVHGQGNWGCIDDPKSFAAMRYTEAKLTYNSNLFLEGLNKDSVDWSPNFDGTMNEPKFFPTQVPTILLNGCSGIAVGMATDIPPHNITNVIDATIHRIKKPKCSVEDLIDHLQGPDSPTGCDVLATEADLMEIYSTGRGAVTMQATYHVEGEDLIFTSIPYQATTNRILEQIADLMRKKKVPYIVDLKDVGDDQEPVKIVVTMRSKRVPFDDIASYLFSTTSLQTRARINMNVIGLDGRPHQMGIHQLVDEWITFRKATIVRSLNAEANALKAKAHVLEGMLRILPQIDVVIAIIRKSDSPKPDLMKKLKISSEQADAILNLRLREITRLEENAIQTRYQTIQTRLDEITKILSNNGSLNRYLVKSLEQAKTEYGDARRSKLVDATPRTITEEDLVGHEDITVIVTEGGWIRSTKEKDLNIDSLSVKSGDRYLSHVHGDTGQLLILQDSVGRTYSINPKQLPSARGYGEPITKFLRPANGGHLTGLVMGKPDKPLLLTTDNGFGFSCRLEDAFTRASKGRQTATVPKGGKPNPMVSLEGCTHVALLSDISKLLILPIAKVNYMASGRGDRLIEMRTSSKRNPDGRIASVVAFNLKDGLAVWSGQRKKVLTTEEIRQFIGHPGDRGEMLPAPFHKATALSTTT